MHKLSEKIKIKNSMGLHTRPATAIVKLLQTTSSEVQFTLGEETVDARSILGILMLAAKKDATLQVTVEGVDAEKTLALLKEAFESKFGEK